MDNIDDLMRQKFDSDVPSERFEFSEEYWEQAQALLDREEKRKRRRWWLFWFSVLLCCITLYNAPEWYDQLSQSRFLSTGQHNNPTQNTSSIPHTPENDNRQNHNNPPQSSNNTSTPSQNSSTTENTKTAGNPPEAAQKTGSDRLDQSNTSGTTLPGKDDSTIALKGTTKEGKRSGKYTGNIPLTEKGGPPISSLSNTSDQLGNVNPVDKNISTLQAASGNAQDRPENKVSNLTAGPLDATTNADSVATAKHFYDIQSIIMELRPIFITPKNVKAPALQPIPAPVMAQNTHPVSDKRLSLGLNVAVGAFPDDTLGRWLGYACGFDLRYKINRNWSAGAGVQWRFVPGFPAFPDTLNPGSVSLLRYSFGFENTTWERQTVGLHQVEIPAQVNWQKGRWLVSAGGSISSLLMAQEKHITTYSNSFQGPQTTTQRFLKGRKSNYRGTGFSASAGLAFSLSPRIDLMARGHYRFTPVYKSVADGAENKGYAHLDLGLRFRIY